MAFRRSGVARNRFPVRKSIVKRIGMPPFQSPPLVAIPLGDPEFRFFFCMSPFSFGAKHRRAQPISVAGRRPTHWTRPISCSQGQTAKPKWESSVRRRRRNSFGNHERLFLFFFFLAGGGGRGLYRPLPQCPCLCRSLNPTDTNVLLLLLLLLLLLWFCGVFIGRCHVRPKTSPSRRYRVFVTEFSATCAASGPRWLTRYRVFFFNRVSSSVCAGVCVCATLWDVTEFFFTEFFLADQNECLY